MDYINELLFFKGFSLEMMTAKKMAKQMIDRPVIMRGGCSMIRMSGVEKTVHTEDYVPDPKKSDRVLIYLPRTCKDDKYETIYSTKITKECDEEGKYLVECFGDLPLELMDQEYIEKECPQKPAIIGKTGTKYDPGQIVQVYMPHFVMVLLTKHSDEEKFGPCGVEKTVHTEDYVPDPKKSDRVLVCLPRTCKHHKYETISTKITKECDEEGKYLVECFGDLPLELMDQEYIEKECPQKAAIIGKTGTKGQVVRVYMPYFVMAGTVTNVDTTDIRKRKKFDVRYDFSSSRISGRTRFFATARELWKKIPGNFEYPETDDSDNEDPRSRILRRATASGFQDPASKAENAAASIDRNAGSGAEYGESKTDSNSDDGLERSWHVANDLQEKGFKFDRLCETLKKHGVGDDDILLYSSQIFPEGQNAVEYMGKLVKDTRTPLNVVAAYMGVLAKIKTTEQKRLRERLGKALREMELGAKEKTVETKEERPDYQGSICKLLEAINDTTHADELREEKAKNRPDRALIQKLEDKVKQNEVELKNRQKPFIQWLQAFATLIDGDGVFGPLGEWARTLNSLEKEQRDRRDKQLEKFENVKKQTEPMLKDTSTADKDKLEQVAKELLELLDAPISLSAAFYKRLFALLCSILAALFTVLAYVVFGQGDFTLTTFIGVQASIFAIFYQNTTQEQFEKDSLRDALAYHVNCFRTVYDEDLRAPNGRMYTEIFKCNVLCCRGKVNTRYHKWRAMAIFKMIQDRKKQA